MLGATLASKEGCSDGLEVVVRLLLLVDIELGITVVVGDDDGAPDEESLHLVLKKCLESGGFDQSMAPKMGSMIAGL